jgi:hypothetical protein
VSFARETLDWEMDAFGLFFNMYLARMRWEGEDSGSLPKEGCMVLNPSTLS